MHASVRREDWYVKGTCFKRYRCIRGNSEGEDFSDTQNTWRYETMQLVDKNLPRVPMVTGQTESPYLPEQVQQVACPSNVVYNALVGSVPGSKEAGHNSILASGQCGDSKIQC